ncbi:MAG: hypothetical protein MR419_12320, partial [Clostridiales bacterium]|nr:hypothetical protein [Clostridiales bacterium]
VALGYKSDIEVFYGNAWDTNVNVLATQKGLYDELESIDVSAALTRDSAAQMIWNALQAKEVKYEYTLVSENGQLVSKVTLVDKADTLMEDKYDADTSDPARLVKVTKDTNKDTYTLTLDGTPAKFTKVDTDYSDLIGQNVKVVYKDTDDVLGVFADEDCSVVAEGIVGQLALDSKAGDKSIKLDGTAYDLDQAANATPVYRTDGKTAEGKLSDQMTSNQAACSIKLIDTDGDGDVNQAVFTKATVAKITYANSTGIRVGSTAYDFDDHHIYDGAAKDDWAVIVDAGYTADGKAIITKADVVSGKVTSVNGSTGEVRIDGKWYDKAASATAPTIKSDVDLVVYGGMYFNCEGSTTDLDVAVVTGVGNYDRLSDTTSVELMFNDGTKKVVPVEKWNNKPASGNNAFTGAAKMMVSYTIDDDNYSLTTLVDTKKIDTSDYTAVVQSSATYDKSISAVTVSAKSYDVSDTAFVVIYNATDDKYVYMTGADLLNRNDITFSKIYAAVDGNEIGAMFGITAASITSGDTLYGYITDSYVALNADDKEKLYIDVIVDGKKLEDVETDKTSAVTYSAISYTMDGDVMCITDESSDVKYIDAIDEFNATRVIFHNQGRLPLAKDVVIIAIDSENADDVLYAGNAMIAADADSWNGTGGAADGWLNNALYGVNSDNEVDIIFVQVSAETEFDATAVTLTTP